MDKEKTLLKNQKLVLIPDRLSLQPDIEQNILGSNVKILNPCARNITDISDDIWSSADGIIAWHDLNFTEGLIKKLTNCKVLVRCGVGVDNIDLKAASVKGIPVCNVPDYGTNDVADHTMGLILMLFRGINTYNDKVRKSNNNWNWDSAGLLRRLTGVTLGIVGLGRIGTAVALRAKAFGLNIVFYDPYIPDGKDKALGVERIDTMEEFLKNIDILTFHCPLTSETDGMADRAFFQMLKPGAIVINTARGRIIQLNALMDALKSYTVRSAGLDVLEIEPPEENHPLIRGWRIQADWIAHRLIITPHAAFYCKESFEELRRKAAEEVNRAFCSLPLRNVINSNYFEKMSPL